MRRVILVHVYFEPHPINAPHLSTCSAAMSRSGQLVRSVGNAPGHRGLDTARETTPAVHRCGYRPRELQPARRRRLGRASSGSRDALASCAAYGGANDAFEDLFAQPPPPSRCCVSGQPKPAMKVSEVISWSSSGGNGGRTSICRDGVRKSRRVSLYIDPDPPMPLTNRLLSCEEMAIFAVRLNVPGAGGGVRHV